MRVRPVLTVLCCLAAAAAMALEAQTSSPDRVLIIGTGVVAGLAGVLLAVRPFWAALAGRGLAWTALAMMTLCESATRPRALVATAAFALCAGLLAAGRQALDRAPSTFQPSHHRGPLVLALVLGFADVATLTGWSLLAVSEVPTIALVFFSIAAAIAVSLYGLYRLRTWGFLLNLVVNLAVVGLMLVDVFHFSVLRIVFIVPAVAQILLALPILVAIIRRRPISMPAALSRLAGWVPAAAILTMAAINVQVWFGPAWLVQVARWGMHHL